MDEQCSSLGLGCYYQEEGFVEELKHSLLYSSLELEAAVISAHEEISRKDDEIVQLKGLIETIVKERDEFDAKCGQLVFEKNLLSQQLASIQTHCSSKQLSECPSSSNVTSTQHDDSSDSDDNNKIATSPNSCNNAFPPLQQPILDITYYNLSVTRPLPEKGKFLQAIMEAGPLLQTLLLAGPLPQWQHPPPQLNSGDIPPVKIFSPVTKLFLQDSCLNSPTTSCGLPNKRAMINMEGHDISPNSKHQKVCPPSIIDPIPTPID